MDKLGIGLVQERWYPDQELHQARLREGVSRAAQRGAGLVCLQELTLSPYFPTSPGVDSSRYAESIPDGPTCKFARELARQYGVYLTASLFEATGKGYNTAICYSAQGELVGLTRKQHIPGGPGYHEDEHFHPGESDYPVHKIAGVQTALPTCYDQWFPELARIYALKRAELIIYPTAIGSEPSAPEFDSQPMWQKVIVANGIMNNVFMLAVNRVGEEGGVVFYGSSFVSDPLGNILAQAPRHEPAVLVVDLDFSVRDLWGKLFPFLKQRQPKTYSRLLCA
ncbi:MAG TPA: nitrilase-related carbon-nitrogen hydrolase [Anaerolineales bacterium]|nr:nitrilase-related carbon-nitrogen hydrolase [Anaerolineales bacterium]